MLTATLVNVVLMIIAFAVAGRWAHDAVKASRSHDDRRRG